MKLIKRKLVFKSLRTNTLNSQNFAWFLPLLFFYLFTSFSGHRPAQRECARTGTQVTPYGKNPINRKGWPQRRGLRPLLLSNSDVGSFTSHKNKSVIVLWDGTYGFLSLSEKTWKSNHLQMSLQRKFALCMATGTPNSRKVLRLKSSSRTPESP